MVDINTYSQNPTFSSEIEWNFQLNKALKVANLQDLEVVNIKEQDNKKKKKNRTGARSISVQKKYWKPNHKTKNQLTRLFI